MDAFTSLLFSAILEGIEPCNRNGCKNNNLQKKGTYAINSRRRKILKIMILQQKFQTPSTIPKTIPKVQKYLDVIHQFDNDTFYSHFRMSRNSFNKLSSTLEPYYTHSGHGHPPVYLEEALYMTIWFLSNKNSFREIGDRFGRAKSASFEVLIKTCKLLKEIQKLYVKWPETTTEVNSIVDGFNKLRKLGFPNVIGCIDGMHIKIKPPISDSSSYYNRKGFHSIILQGVCKSDQSFLNVFVGWPGRSHDACVFENSALGKGLTQNKISLPPDVHIIGDSAYKLSTFLMTPFKDNGNLTYHQKIYNEQLSSTRVVIEQSFRLLKSKFRILDSLNFNHLENAKFIIMACVILHNFIIAEEQQTINVEYTSFDDAVQVQHLSNTTAEQKRMALCHMISSGR